MTKFTDIDVIAAVEKYGSQRAAAKALGMAKSTYQDRLVKALATAYTSRKQPEPIRFEPTAQTRYAFFTSAQDCSEVHPFLGNLETYAASLNAPIHIGGYTYNKSLFEDHSKHRASFAPSVRPYLTNHRMEIAGDLLFCGEMNTLPTAVRPLQGFETYTRSKWGIFPHAKIQLHSVPTMQHEPAKILMTTGTVTKPNYIQKKAGIKAEFHHMIGAIIVEILPNGDFFCRHIISEDDGSFYDLGTRVSQNVITYGHRIKTLVPGDIHYEKLNFDVLSGLEDFYDIHKPEFTFIHDLIDFTPRNHHSINDPYFRFKSFNNREDNVEKTINDCAMLLSDFQRPWGQIIVDESNHDLAFQRWLKTADYRNDPGNALFFLRAQLQQYEALAHNDDRFSIFEWALRRVKTNLGDTKFLREDDSFRVLDVEHGMHGHQGANGSLPSPMQYTRMGPKVTAAHTHTACIMDGYMSVGVTGDLRMGYNNSGMSSWSHTLAVMYQNGKRVLCTMQNGKFSANS